MCEFQGFLITGEVLRSRLPTLNKVTAIYFPKPAEVCLTFVVGRINLIKQKFNSNMPNSSDA
jgi:hypothetical protein